MLESRNIITTMSHGYYYTRKLQSCLMENSLTLSEGLQAALSIVQQWCGKTLLSINPNKMVIMPLSRKRNIKGHKEPTKQ
jgi:hypothetical protein